MRITWQYQCILYYRKLQATLNTFNVEALNRFMPFTGEECSLETFLPRPFYAHMNSLRRLSVYILLKNFQVFLSRERIICLILFSFFPKFIYEFLSVRLKKKTYISIK